MLRESPFGWLAIGTLFWSIVASLTLTITDCMCLLLLYFAGLFFGSFHSTSRLQEVFQIKVLLNSFPSKTKRVSALNDLPLYLQIDVGEFTFSRQQLKTCVKLGNTFTRLLLFLTKDVQTLDVLLKTGRSCVPWLELKLRKSR